MSPTDTHEPADSPQFDQIIPRVIEEEMKIAYINYAMSVIVGRALPEIRDGLKPVHRRILYSMKELGVFHNKSFKKCARIVGDCLGKFHPHGDSSVYDALVRMAQEFSLRYPLVKGQGNFGSIDGDSAASMRYTEAKLQKISEDMLKDIEKNTVDFKDNFDGSLQEPSILPTKIPNLLINGSSGIAVGMATNIPPHNVSEVCTGVIATIDNPEITVQELMEIIPAPDFPTGGEVGCGSSLLHAYTKGRGKVTLKAVSEVSDTQIIISEIPYQVNKEDLILQIAALVRNKVVPGIRNINDESDQDGIRVVIDLKRDTDGNIVLNQLYKHSRLRISFGLNLLALVNNQPTLLGLKDFMQHHISHRVDIITRRTQYDLEQAQKRLHILDGLLVALSNIDDVVAGIRRSSTVEDAKQFLIGTYSLSDLQAKAILEMRLQKLAALEQDKIKSEHNELEEKVKDYLDILASKERVLTMIKTELEEVKEQYGDSRRSKIVQGDDTDIDLEDLIEEGTVVVTMSHAGYVKRLPIDTYKTQKRGGKGVIAAGTKEEDFVEKLYVTSTHDYLLYFTNQGQVFWQKVYHLPEGSRQSKGKHISNVLELRSEETVSAIVPVRSFEEGYLFMATRNGTVKKTSLQDFSRPRKGGIRAISLDEEDALIGVKYTDGNNEILLATKKGSANRFKESDVRAMGRTARGVRGIRLRGHDEVIGMLAADEGMKILTITEKGYGKRTDVGEYRLCNRGGKGVTNIKITEKNGPVKAVMLVDGSEDLMLVSRDGIGIRMKCSDISVIGRATQGVRVMRLKEGDQVAAAAKIVRDDEEPEEVVGNDLPPQVEEPPMTNEDQEADSVDQHNPEEPEKVHEQPVSYSEEGIAEEETNVVVSEGIDIIEPEVEESTNSEIQKPVEQEEPTSNELEGEDIQHNEESNNYGS